MIIRQSVLMCMLLLAILFVGCVTPIKHQKLIEEDYGCKPPPPDVFTAAGIDMQFAQSTFGKVITGEINIKTNPQVIALASKAVTDDRIRSYLRCLAIHRDGYTPEQAAYFDTLSAFVRTSPTADQFLQWQKKNPFSPKEDIVTNGEIKDLSETISLRRKIKSITIDPQNEVESPERWRILTLTTSLEMIGIFDLIKDKEINILCESQEDHNIIEKFVDTFLEYRRLATEIDNYMFTVVGDNVHSDYTPYWNKVAEYCKLRLLGVDEKETEKRIKTWTVSSDFEDCRKLYAIFVQDKTLENKLTEYVKLCKKVSQIFKEINWGLVDKL